MVEILQYNSGFFQTRCHCTVKATKYVRTRTYISWYVCHWLWFSRKNVFNLLPKFIWSIGVIIVHFFVIVCDAFLIFLLHLFLKVLYDFQSSLDLDFLAFLNVWSRLFINFLVSISSHGQGLRFTRFSIWGACVWKTNCKEDVKYCTAKSTLFALKTGDQSILEHLVLVLQENNLYNFYILLFLNYSKFYLSFSRKRSYCDLLLSLEKHLYSLYFQDGSIIKSIKVDDASVVRVRLVIPCFNPKMLSDDLKSLWPVLL